MFSHFSLNLMFVKSLSCHFESLIYHILLHINHLYFLLDNNHLLLTSAHYSQINNKLQMSNSPYLPADIKNYIKKHQIETLINQTVNNLLKNMPEDPYAYIIGTMQQFASPSIELLDINLTELISADGFPVLKIRPTVKYLNKDLTFAISQPLSILSDQNMLYDQDRLAGKGLLKTIKFAKQKLFQNIRNLKCEQQDEIDRQLQKSFADNNNTGLYALNCLSLLPSLIRSHLLCIPLNRIYSQLVENTQKKQIKCMINALHGGKAIGSKCKIFKYYIICKNVAQPTLLQTVLQAIRKTIVSGKGGQAALKISPDATYICPLDTIADNLKIVEDAIVSSGAKQLLSIGLSWQADTLYSPDTKKYQLQNPKTPFDNDQMIDYLMKLLQDKPIIQYLQDPLAFSQKASWKKLITRIRQTEATKHVKIGTRHGKLFNLLNPNLKASINQVSVQQTADTHPQSTEQARKATNALKFRLDFVQVRAYELRTLTNLLKVYKQFKQTKTELIIQDCSYQTYDTSLIDIAYGLNCYSNLGSISKYDRICKLNRMKQILQQNREAK